MEDFIVVVNKEKGMTSFDVVAKLKRIFNTSKVGHTGTLDPNATGVLVCAINNGTKLVQYLESDIKTYECRMVLGIETNTFDIWGDIVKEEDVEIDSVSIDKCLKSFIGDYYQTPTMYSANKINGKKLYEYARNNIEVEVDKKLVHIFDMKWNNKTEIIDKHIYINFTVVVSKGTYIRSLCHDIGERLNTCGCMTELNRIQAGNYSINTAYSLDDILNGKFKKYGLLESITYPKYELTDERLFKKVSNGLPFYLVDMDKLVKNSPDYVCFYLGDKLVGIYKKFDNSYKADRIWK